MKMLALNSGCKHTVRMRHSNACTGLVSVNRAKSAKAPALEAQQTQ